MKLNIALFVITAITTTVAGAIYANDRFDAWLPFILRGWVFSVPLMSILLTHEMGHFLAGKRRRLDVTPPYFLPAPPPLGTFGAFIKIRSPIPDRDALMEVGAAGPLAGSVIAIPLLLLGLFLSEPAPRALEPVAAGFSLGSSILLEMFCLLRFGDYSSHLTVFLHPTALAAWFGLFVTAMNLLPVGQLDGGHVIYALVGERRARLVSFGFLGCMLVLGILYWPGWLVFGVLVTILGLRHPPPLDGLTPLSRSRRIVGMIALVLFVLTFIPAPIEIIE